MKILFIQNRILFPTNTGGRIRTLNVLRYLARWHDVTYLCNLEAGEEPHCDAMREIGVQLETIPWRSPALGEWKFYFGLALNMFSRLPFNVAKDNNPALRARAEQLGATARFPPRSGDVHGGGAYLCCVEQRQRDLLGKKRILGREQPCSHRNNTRDTTQGRTAGAFGGCRD